MCLNTVDKETRQAKEGYKAVQTTRMGLSSVCRGNGRTLPVGVWLDESLYADSRGVGYIHAWEDGEEGVTCGEYPRGWHSYLTEEDAWNCGLCFDAVVKVKIKEVLASGIQWERAVVVSRFIKIVEVLK